MNHWAILAGAIFSGGALLIIAREIRLRLRAHRCAKAMRRLREWEEQQVTELEALWKR